MEEKTLFKIAFSVSLIGIFILLFISEKTNIKSIQISSINPSMLDQQIKVNGKVEKITKTGLVSIIQLKDETSSIKVVAFENLTINKDDTLEVTGKITSYKNELEIDSDKIIVK